MAGIFQKMPAQSLTAAKAVIEKINTVYQGKSSYQTEMEYRLYKDFVTEDIHERDTATMIHSNDVNIFRMGDVVTFSDKELDIMVNRADKIIAVANHNEKLTNPLAGFVLDSILSICTQAKISNYGEADCLYLGLSGLDAAAISVCYDNRDYSLKKMVIYYQTERRLDEEDPNSPMVKPRLEMHYLKTKVNPEISSAQLKPGYYLRKKGNEYTPAAAFSGYTVLNQVIEYK